MCATYVSYNNFLVWKVDQNVAWINLQLVKLHFFKLPVIGFHEYAYTFLKNNIIKSIKIFS